MTDTLFMEIIDELVKIHELYPTWRFGQVLQVALDNEKFNKNINFNDYSSKNILRCLKSYYYGGNTRVKKRDLPYDSFDDDLIAIDGIGQKTFKDVKAIYETKQELLDALNNNKHMPLSDDVIKKLDKKFRSDKK